MSCAVCLLSSTQGFYTPMILNPCVACAKDPSCMFDNTKNMCRPHCSKLLTTDACTLDTDCEPYLGACVEKCGNLDADATFDRSQRGEDTQRWPTRD